MSPRGHLDFNIAIQVFIYSKYYQLSGLSLLVAFIQDVSYEKNQSKHSYEIHIRWEMSNISIHYTAEPIKNDKIDTELTFKKLRRSLSSIQLL